MKEKGSVKKAMLQVLAVMAEEEMEVNIYSWPPICAGILHQPERPVIPDGSGSRCNVN